MPLMSGRLCCPGGSNPLWHPLTESSGVVGGGPSPPSLLVASGGPARVENGTCRRVDRRGVEGLDGGVPRVELEVLAQVVVPVGCLRSTTTIGMSPRIERRYSRAQHGVKRSAEGGCDQHEALSPGGSCLAAGPDRAWVVCRAEGWSGMWQVACPGPCCSFRVGQRGRARAEGRAGCGVRGQEDRASGSGQRAGGPSRWADGVRIAWRWA